MKNPKKLVVLFALAASLVFTSCLSPEGMVRVSEIDGVARRVCDRHDAMLNGTLKAADVTAAQKVVYLRSTEILRKVLDTAGGTR